MISINHMTGLFGQQHIGNEFMDFFIFDMGIGIQEREKIR